VTLSFDQEKFIGFCKSDGEQCPHLVCLLQVTEHPTRTVSIYSKTIIK